MVDAPDSHRVLLDTPVRVREVGIEPGSREPQHTHRHRHRHRHRSVMIVDGPARIRYHEHGELTFESPPCPSPKPPRVIWMDPEGPHSVENIDTTRYHAFRVEILDRRNRLEIGLRSAPSSPIRHSCWSGAPPGVASET